MKINAIVRKLKELSDLHPRINSFGCGQLDDLQQDVENYPYMWLLMDEEHSIGYTEDNGYRSIEFTFVLRIGDKKNDQTGYIGIEGIGQDNQLDIISNTFQYCLDVINTLSEDTLGFTPDIKLVDDVTVNPFFNEDNGDVCGNEATFTIRLKNDKVCINALTI